MDRGHMTEAGWQLTEARQPFDTHLVWGCRRQRGPCQWGPRRQGAEVGAEEQAGSRGEGWGFVGGHLGQNWGVRGQWWGQV